MTTATPRPPAVGDVHTVTFRDGTTLNAVLCTSTLGLYWFGITPNGEIYSAFHDRPGASSNAPDLIEGHEPLRMPAEYLSTVVAGYAARLRSSILASLPDRQEDAIRLARINFGSRDDEDFDPDRVEPVGPSPSQYAQYVDVLTALAARFVPFDRNDPDAYRYRFLEPVPMPTEEY